MPKTNRGNLEHYACHYGNQKEIDEFYQSYDKPIKLNCKQCGWVNEKDVKFIDIEEDFQGVDLLTFKCLCGKVRKSRRFG